MRKARAHGPEHFAVSESESAADSTHERDSGLIRVGETERVLAAPRTPGGTTHLMDRAGQPGNRISSMERFPGVFLSQQPRNSNPLSGNLMKLGQEAGPGTLVSERAPGTFCSKKASIVDR